MELYNPLSQLAYMPKLDLTPISNMVKEQQLQKQQADEKYRTQELYNKIGKSLSGMQEDPMQGQLLSDLSQLDPRMAMSYLQNQQRAQAQQRELDPEVLRMRELGDNAFIEGEKILQEYLQTDIDDPKRQELQNKYNELLNINFETDRFLTLQKIPGHGKLKMVPFNQAVARMTSLVNAERLGKAKLKLTEAEAKDIEAKTQAERTASNLRNQQLAVQLDNLKKDAQDRLGDKIGKALSSRKLLYPEQYDLILGDAQTATNQESLFALVKILAQTIEPGLSVQGSETDGYTFGGQGALAKYMTEMVGAGSTDYKKINSLIVDFINRRKVMAQDVINRGGSIKELSKEVAKNPTKKKQKADADLTEGWE